MSCKWLPAPPKLILFLNCRFELLLWRANGGYFAVVFSLIDIPWPLTFCLNTKSFAENLSPFLGREPYMISYWKQPSSICTALGVYGNLGKTGDSAYDGNSISFQIKLVATLLIHAFHPMNERRRLHWWRSLFCIKNRSSLTRAKLMTWGSKRRKSMVWQTTCVVFCTRCTKRKTWYERALWLSKLFVDGEFSVLFAKESWNMSYLDMQRARIRLRFFIFMR